MGFRGKSILDDPRRNLKFVLVAVYVNSKFGSLTIIYHVRPPPREVDLHLFVRALEWGAKTKPICREIFQIKELA